MDREWAKDANHLVHLRHLMAVSDTLRLPGALAGLGVDFARAEQMAHFHAGVRLYLHKRYNKVLVLAEFIEANLGDGDGPESILASCESFAAGHARQWLKVAGDEKASLVEQGLERRLAEPWSDAVVEFGTFVGYTLCRMSWRVAGRSPIITVESDAVHVLMARHIVGLGRVSLGVDIFTGQAQDVIKRISEEFGGMGAGFTFMDHRGTRFHEDAASLERLRVVAPGARHLADNVLKPGAPEILWRQIGSAPRGERELPPTSWSLPEFVQEFSEDWMLMRETAPPARRW